ncbi:MAG TPA: VWA domain-containing protein [Thermoanaerobaculia bacterium]|jgi:VWFA-related protein
MTTRRLLCALSLLLVSAIVFAQSDPQQQQFGEEIEVRVIDVDVVVTDRQGNPIMNLTRDDFELYEDNKRVEIAYFSRIADGRLTDVPPLQQPSTIATGVAPAAPRMPLTWVIFIDHTNLSPQRRNQAMRQLQVFLQRAIVGGDRGVIALNDGRSFKIRQGLTEDAKLLMEQLARMEKERMPVSPIQQRSNQVLNDLRTRDNHLFATRDTRVLVRDEDEFHSLNTGNAITTLIEEEAARTKNAIMAMGALLDTLARLEGRMAMVYVGAGFNALPGSNLAEAWRSRFSDRIGAPHEPRPQSQQEAIQREITRLFNTLSALRVTVYSIHGGEQGGGPASVEDRGQTNVLLNSVNDISELGEAGSSREMAQRTGGLFFKVSQDLAVQLEAVRRDLSNYYSLGYKPAGSPSDARRVRVKVKGDGLRVRHRETVRERTRQEKASASVVASLVQPQPRVANKVQQQPVAAALTIGQTTAANPLGVAVEAERPRHDGWGSDIVLPFRFSINLDALTFTKANNAHRASFVMHFALVGKDGAVYPLESREQTLAIPEKDMPARSDVLVSYAWHVDLAPLKVPPDVPAKQDGMRLSVTVEDHGSAVRSIITVPVGKEKDS